ncbi:MAG: N-acetylglucosamine-6-phosphate deacetylase [Anaerolineaceae bacterium]|nr:N-acetylglucosamine-6-phosphate deacetylase [Anaerolineaceae bacterium]
MSIQITNANIFTPFQTIENGDVLISTEGKILYTGVLNKLEKQTDQVINAAGYFLAPGLIDIHVHGGYGVAFGLADLKESLQEYSQSIVKTGVTGFLLSIAAPDADTLLGLIQSYVPILEDDLPGAIALGLHLEGPFLNKEKKGAFNPTWLRKPDLEEVNAIIKAGKGWIKQVTIAPELKNADKIAKTFQDANVVVALGHSNTDFKTASDALKGSFSHVTHTYNAQSSFNHREPGVIGAVLASDKITAELIADRVHVHPGAMKILYRCLGKDRIILITDAMPGAGLPDGPYKLIGQDVIVKDGRAELTDGTIAGSTAQLIDCVANIHQDLNLSLNDALQLATYNPSKLMGWQDQLGSIEEGMDANLIVFDKEFKMRFVLVQGRIVYQA